MATITSANLGNGNGSYTTDIVVKDLDMTVSNYVKDRTPVTNMAMSKKRKVNSTLHIWPIDYFRTPTLNAKLEGASVNTNQVENNTRANLGNYTQIFTTTIGATGTARAVEQAGGDPQAYQEVKQLTEIMFDVELQMVRADGASIKYSGQAATQGASPNDGRRFGSLYAFAGTRSGNDTDGTSVLNIATSDSNDTIGTTANTNTPFNGLLSNAGLGYFTFSSGVTLQAFSPVLYKQLVTTAEQRFNAKITNMVVPTSLRTTISDNIPQSRSINRFNPADKGDTIGTTVNTNTPFNGILSNAGLGSFTFSTGVTLQAFSPVLYKQLVTTAEQRFNAKITNMVVPTSLRTTISDNIPQSRSINRFNPADKGDTIGTYEGDFNYTYQIDDSWVMDQTGSDNTSILFLNPDVVQWGSLRELGPNNEVFSNADASLDQYIMEGTLIVRNPAGVAVLAGMTTGSVVTSPRATGQVARYLT